MLIVHRQLAIPIWAVGISILFIGAPPRVRPLLAGLLGLVAIAFAIPMLVSRWRRSRPYMEVLPPIDADPPTEGIVMRAATRIRTLQEAAARGRRHSNAAADLLRMDDDGARPPPAQPNRRS